MNMQKLIIQTRSSLGNNVVEAQRKAGLADCELAARCGLNERELAAIKAGEANVPIDTLANLASALGVTLSQLVA